MMCLGGYSTIFISKAFITFMGLDYSSFQYLLNKFSPLYHRYSPYSVNGKIVTVRDSGLRSGRPHSLGPADCRFSSQVYENYGILFTLQMVFGASHSVLCLFLKFSIRLLFRVLKEEVDARVELPSAEEVVEYQEVVCSNFPALDGAWCVMDGLKISIQKVEMSQPRMPAIMVGFIATSLVTCWFFHHWEV
jgi:hypothetical protein